MKTALCSIFAISLIQVIAAQPHKRHVHGRQHEKRDISTVLQTVVAVATSIPEVIVYVDQDGKPVSTATHTLSAATPSLLTLSPSATPTQSQAIALAPAVAKVEAKPESISSSSTLAPLPETKTEALSAATPTSTAPAEVSAPVSSGSGGFGYTYSPYNTDNSCKTADQVLQDFAGFDEGVGHIRTYGTDCGTIGKVYPAVKKYGYKLVAGIFNIADISNEVKLIVEGVGNDWSSIDTISVGNELVNSGQADAGAVVAALNTAKGYLKSAGYTGPVIIVDTLEMVLKYPEICDASDYCGVNCHPFFDSNTPASSAGSFLTKKISSLKSVLANPSQRIVITETGWPTKGDSNGAAVPSPSNQAAAISSIKSTFSSSLSDIFILSPYNTKWKKSDASQFNAEQYWGVLGDCKSG